MKHKAINKHTHTHTPASEGLHCGAGRAAAVAAPGSHAGQSPASPVQRSAEQPPPGRGTQSEKM